MCIESVLSMLAGKAQQSSLGLKLEIKKMAKSVLKFDIFLT